MWSQLGVGVGMGTKEGAGAPRLHWRLMMRPWPRCCLLPGQVPQLPRGARPPQLGEGRDAEAVSSS